MATIIPNGVTIVAQLSLDFRIVLASDGKQWVLEKYDDLEGRWRTRTSCRTRPALLNCVALYAGDLTDEARAILESLPWNCWWPETTAPVSRKKRRAG